MAALDTNAVALDTNPKGGREGGLASPSPASTGSDLLSTAPMDTGIRELGPVGDLGRGEFAVPQTRQTRARKHAKHLQRSHESAKNLLTTFPCLR